jgi:hypothetical protein
MNDFIEADRNRQQPTLSKEENGKMSYDITILKGQTTSMLQCIVKAL